VSAESQSRREAIRRAALGAGALAVASVIQPPVAAAQSDDEDLRDFLVEAITLEQLTVLAYSTAASDADSDQRPTLEQFRDQEQAHASALRTALDSLGFDLPSAPDSTTDDAAFEDVEGLDETASKKRIDLLDELDGLRTPREYFEYLSKLEAEQLALYADQGAEVDSVDLSRTSAEIAGCQAQHMIVLGGQLGESSEQAAAEAATAAADAIPAASA
jgi:rubrerythrin